MIKKGEDIDEKIDQTEENIDEVEDKIEDLKNEVEELTEDREELEEDHEINEAEKIKEVNEEIQRKEAKKKEVQDKIREAKEKMMKQKEKKDDTKEIKRIGFKEMMEERRILNLSQNEFAMYNVDWFNICCGIETYDELYEYQVVEEIKQKGIRIDTEEIVKKIKLVLNDEKESKLFKRMIKSRILSCSEMEEPSLYESIFSDTLASFKECDKREDESVLYLYDEYKAFLNRKLAVPMNRMDRTLIFIFCESIFFSSLIVGPIVFPGSIL